MNYYPYMMNMPLAYQAARPGLFSNLFKGFNFSSILSGTGKVLNVANQAIPLIKQVKPVINNAKTMFNVMNEFRKVDNVNNANATTIKNNNLNNINRNTNNNSNKSNYNIASNINTSKNDSLPTFFQ